MAEDDAIDIRRRQAALFEQLGYRAALVVLGQKCRICDRHEKPSAIKMSSINDV
jgi:hypothetical protein